MDRVMNYSGQIPLETDLLYTNRFGMTGLGFLAQDILGSSTLVSGFACTPTSPASMSVNVAAGRIYALANLDATAFSSLAADTTHSLIKQGIMLDSAALTMAAPTTSGMSVNYLIEAAFSEVDSGSTVLPYYNAAAPAYPFSGPNDTGISQATQRLGTVVLTAKAGVAATTGSQTTPSVDSGNVGLWVVTIAYGQSTIIAGNINAYNSGAAWIQNTLNLLAPLASPALSGTPTAPTPAMFDSSTKLATTAFVQRALGNYRQGVQYTASQTLTASQVGEVIVASGSTAMTMTLPPLAGIPSGGGFRFVNQSANPLTIAPAGADALYDDSLSGAKASISVARGGFVDVVVIAGAWFATGTGLLGVSPMFASGPNWFQHPAGFIVQYGSFSSNTSADTSVTFPHAFPSAVAVIMLTPSASGSGVFAEQAAATRTGFNGSAWSSSSARVAATIGYIAIGV